MLHKLRILSYFLLKRLDKHTQRVYYNRCKEVREMSKKKKKGKNKTLEIIVFATAILNLIYSIIELLKSLLE